MKEKCLKEEKCLKKDMYKPYWIVVDEYLYPNSVGRKVYKDFDDINEALDFCRELCECEVENNWEIETGVDPLGPTETETMDFVEDGYIISAKNGLDEWFYRAKVVKVEFGK